MTDGDAKYAARKLVLGAVISASIATAMSSAGIADATGTSVRGTGRARNAQTSRPASRSSSTRSPRFRRRASSAAAVRTIARVMAPRVFRLVPNPRPRPETSAPSNGRRSRARGRGMVGHRCFRPVWLRGFRRRRSWPHHRDRHCSRRGTVLLPVTGRRGLDHHETPIPRGALVFSKVPTETMSTSPRRRDLCLRGRTGGSRRATGTATRCRSCPPPTSAPDDVRMGLSALVAAI